MSAADMRAFGLAFISILLGATGQFLFRLGMLNYGKVTGTAVWRQLFAIIFTPAIFAGFLCFGVSSILWLAVISRWQLSYAYPLVALGYVLAVVYGRVFLQEMLNPAKLVGSLLILLGIIILGWFGKN